MLLAPISELDKATDDGWDVGTRDYIEGTVTPCPHQEGSRIAQRWFSGYDMGYYTAKRLQRKKAS